jgi:outer membrane protein assembly factor BamE (lipoprotein component of BamABCDE complex)
MTRLQTITGCSAAALLPLLSCCVWLGGAHTRSCPDRDRIHTGMTMDEVRGILGNPKTENAGPEGFHWYYECGFFSLSSPISVHFDSAGRVEHTYILD